MKLMKSTISAMALALVAGGAAYAETATHTHANAKTHTSTDISSDAVEGTRNVLNKAGAMGMDAVEAVSDAAGKTADAIGDVGADVMFDVETAYEAGTTEVTSADGYEVGSIDGVRVLDDGAQMVTIDLKEDMGFKAEKVSIKSEYFVKGDGNIGLRVSADRLRNLVEHAPKA